MPKRTDIKKILIIGSGPIVIGQACEFDYSGTQACKALKEEGYEVVLVNSNPATIMTDPEFADKTYIEPITPETLAKIVEKERPDAILPTLGGQTALNTAVALGEMGVLEKYGVELIGANLESIKKAEDRELFKKSMEKIGLQVPKSGLARNFDGAMEVIKYVGFPAIIRPAFTLGGHGGNVAYNMEEYEEFVKWGLDSSPISEILIEESVLGWKEFELEVMRDKNDNVVIICSIENFDAMGVHTGDSITVAPAQTLTDKEYQIMRDAAIKIIREIGVDTGGSNIQFAINPDDGRMVVIEMNPRVSRSSALASKATGFPIAKIATKLAVGYSLDEIPNDITRYTPASFEPTLDYVVVKIPRFTFEKFPQTVDYLTTQMKSVGEVMAIGRTFKETLQKAIRSLEIDKYGFESIVGIQPSMESLREAIEEKLGYEEIVEKLKIPNSKRLWYIGDAYREGISTEKIYEFTKIDPWFLNNIKEIIDYEKELIEKKEEYGNFEKWQEKNPGELKEYLIDAKRMGFSDRRLAYLLNTDEDSIRNHREKINLINVYKRVDTCAAEFEAYTPYLYSSYDEEDEAGVTDRKKIIILGGGPNRIGQGIEFDYCCVHGVFALREEGFETIMVNCNPETVSTDYDTADRLYFEPLTKEDVLAIVKEENPDGVIVQFGGQTPLKLSVPLEREGVKIVGTSPDSIDIAEDRERFQQLLNKLGLKQPANGIARSVEEAVNVAHQIGFPVLVRPSYVLGGRAMEIVYDEEELRRYMKEAVQVSPDHPILIDKFLKDATEMDVDALADGEDVYIGGIMQHIEEAGVHSGDSAAVLPPFSLSEDILEEIAEATKKLALELNVKGLMNVQYAIKDNQLYVLEVNPRASRTVPFVSKVTGVPLAKIAAKVMVGRKLRNILKDYGKDLSYGYGVNVKRRLSYYGVKESVFPFAKFPSVDTILGPEMKSTGEVMGIDRSFPLAFAKAEEGASNALPKAGKVFISVKDEDKASVVEIARILKEKGYEIVATRGTSAYMEEHGIDNQMVLKVIEGRPNIVDLIKNREIAMIINTTSGKQSIKDSFSIRRSAIVYQVPYFTTISAAYAAAKAIEALKKQEPTVKALQEYYGG